MNLALKVVRLRKFLAVLFLENAVEQQSVQLFAFNNDANLVGCLRLIVEVLVEVEALLALPEERLELGGGLLIVRLNLILVPSDDDPQPSLIHALEVTEHTLDILLFDASHHHNSL